MPKSQLSIEKMLEEAKAFCHEESSFANSELFGITDGKAVGTYVEHKFQDRLKLKYEATAGSSAKGIDFPSEEINTDVKVTSIKQPQSSCPFRTAEQKIFGLGYNLLLFVYDKTDSPATKTSQLAFVNCTFIEKDRTADYQTTRSLINLIQNDATEEEVIAYLNDRNLPIDEIGLIKIAEKILNCPPHQGYLTISNALQWRLQYGRIVDLKETVAGITTIVGHDCWTRLLERNSRMTALLENNRDKAEYGDFQTPLALARRVCLWLQAKGIQPEVLVEPTFGLGHFLLAALETFPSIKHVYGVEIHKPYFDETQQRIKKYQNDNKRQIHLFCDDVFRFSFSDIAKQHSGQFILVLGNPPWVTNSWLGCKDSKNIPNKSNIKNVRGIEALTGKGNFDIGESVTLSMLKTFAESKGCFAFLVKNSVVKNIVHAQRQFRFSIACMERIGIDSQKEFDASVDASLFYAKFQEKAGLECSTAGSFETPIKSRFGWYGEKFVSDINKYEQTSFYDGQSPEVWRQGVKHDCAKVMELVWKEGAFHNGYNEMVNIEDDLVFPLLKSSDLKGPIVETVRKFVLVPQNFIGQDTGFIQRDYPRTAAYFNKHKELFEQRKSSIYRDKPPFSIFGIGDYSFKPYKIAISGLYKQTLFSLVPPQKGKPVMLDDTCYFLGFDEPAEAVCVHYLLNHDKIQNLLSSLVFWDGKRVITKEILMRLDYGKLLSEISDIILPLNFNGRKISQKQVIEEKFNRMRFHFSQRKKQLQFID